MSTLPITENISLIPYYPTYETTLAERLDQQLHYTKQLFKVRCSHHRR